MIRFWILQILTPSRRRVLSLRPHEGTLSHQCVLFAALSVAEIDAVWSQIAFEYPFMETVADSAIMTSHQLKDEPIVFCNDEFTQLTGYPKEEILGRNCRFLQGKHTDPKTVQAIRDALKDGSKLELELLNYRKDGIPFLNGFCMLPLHETGKRDGKVMYFLAIQKNVTVRKPIAQSIVNLSNFIYILISFRSS